MTWEGEGMSRFWSRLADERGEGVISLAIAVLVIAALGAVMWVSFSGIWENAEGRIQDSVNQIGN
jgi:hypothetical protein